MIPTHRDIASFIESLAPPPGPDEGFKFGSPNAQTRGVLVCFMPTVAALEAAAAQDCNLVVTHEQLHYPYTFQNPNWEELPTWPVNHARLTLLAKHDLTLYRAHGQLDRFCILDESAAQAGLPEPVVREGYYRIYEIPPVTVRELAARTKQNLGLPHVRVSGDPQRVVRRVGLPWGGLGLSLNVGFIAGLLAYGPDVLIAGECDEYAFRFTEDAGVPMIETAHSASENPGLRRFAQVLHDQFPQIRVVFHEVPCPWQVM